MCLDKQTDCLFTHEVTVMPSDNGSFNYLGNKITYKGQIQLPSSEPRIPAQRTTQEPPQRQRKKSLTEIADRKTPHSGSYSLTGKIFNLGSLT